MMRGGYLLIVMLAGSATARDRDSHIAIPPVDGSQSPRQLLDQKLSEIQTHKLMRDLMRDPRALDPKLREQLLKSQAAADIMRRLRDGDESLLRLVEQLAGDHPALKNLDRERLRQLVSEAARQYTAGSPGLRQPPGMPVLSPTNPFDDADREARKIFNEQVEDLMREWKIDGFAEQLRDSPAFRDLMQDILRNGMKPFQLPGGLKPHQLNLKSLANALTKLRHNLPKNLPGLSGVRGPNVPSNLPNFAFGRPSIPFGSSAAGFGEGWSAIIVVFMTAVGIGVLWWVLRWQPRKARATKITRPIPIDRVNSWSDLVAAFEALALNHCGPDAEHWHHRRIEQQLALQASPADVRALAHFYEQGRYAEQLPTDMNWESVRDRFRRLTGSGR